MSAELSPQQDSSSVADVAEPPTEMTDKQMEKRLARSRGKLELVALREGTYKREGGVWHLLDGGA